LEESLINLILEVVDSQTTYSAASYRKLRESLFVLDCECVKTKEYETYIRESVSNRVFEFTYTGEMYSHTCKKCELIDKLNTKINQVESE
jgi:hypothetical protein